MALKDAQIRSTHAFEKSVKRADGRGLYIEVFPNGSKLWRLKYRFGGKEKRLGMSGSPSTRCDAHNRTLPKCAYSWVVERSTFTVGREAFPTSDHALAGEQAMKDFLAEEGRSLGGEFFLAQQAAVERAWELGIETAEKFGG